MSFYRSTLTLSFYTSISRISGFIRDMMIAAYMGPGTLSDTFLVAFKLPNFFRRLFAEGAFNSAFVPMFSSIMAGEGKEKAIRFAEKVFAVMMVTLLVFTLIMQIAMPLVMLVLAPGFSKNPEQFDMAVLLTRITFPYLLFISLTALLTGVLNSIDKFIAGAVAPIALNLCLIGSLLFLTDHTETTAHALSIGVLIAGIVQFVWLLISCRMHDVSLKLRLPEIDPQVKKMLKLMVPGIIAAGAVNINLWVDMMIATLIPKAISYLYYAERISQLPMAIVGTAIGTVLLPTLSRKFREGNHAEAVSDQNRALEMALFFTLPAMIGMMVIAFPLVAALFERGEFTGADSLAVSYALIAYGVGLPAFVLIKVFTPGFFANHDTKTPVKIAILCMALNIVFNFMFIVIFRALDFYPHIGIALATSLAAWVNIALLVRGLKKRGHYKTDKQMWVRAKKIVFCSTLMALTLWILQSVLEEYGDGSEAARVGSVVVMLASAIVVYFGSTHYFNVYNVSELKQFLKRKPKKHSGT